MDRYKKTITVRYKKTITVRYKKTVTKTGWIIRVKHGKWGKIKKNFDYLGVFIGVLLVFAKKNYVNYQLNCEK